MEEIEEGQLVLCTVTKIVGTTVFVEIENNGEGTITTSEIAPGRIRNLRDYVIPGKKIVCLVLSNKNNKIHLSLRRVKLNEKKEFLNKLEKEKGYKAILKTVLGEKHENVLKEITKDYSLLDFFEKLEENKEILEKYVNKQEAERILKILESKKEKLKEIKKFFKLSNKSSDGIKIIKNILMNACKGNFYEVSYIAAGRYMITLKGKDFKELNTELNNILNKIEKNSKENNCEFYIEK